MEAIIRVMESTIGARDPYTVAHQQRVTRIAHAIAVDLGLPGDRLQELHVAGSLHDLGKVAIPLEILTKPGKLTDIEFALIKSHPQIGYDILKPLNFPESITQIMLQHHERLDGSGYPRGLRGAEILPGARILAVADVVEALCNHRPYRPAMGLERALEEISRHQGVLYDDAVVNSCVRLCQTGRLLPQDAASLPSWQPYEISAPVSLPGPAPRTKQAGNKQNFFIGNQLSRKTSFLFHVIAAWMLGCMFMLSSWGT